MMFLRQLHAVWRSACVVAAEFSELTPVQHRLEGLPRPVRAYGRHGSMSDVTWLHVIAAFVGWKAIRRMAAVTEMMARMLKPAMK
jgi:hypothetical protein